MLVQLANRLASKSGILTNYKKSSVLLHVVKKVWCANGIAGLRKLLCESTQDLRRARSGKSAIFGSLLRLHHLDEPYDVTILKYRSRFEFFNSTELNSDK